MSRPREFDTSAVLDAVTAAFWERGYEATSMADLEERAAVSRSSLYAAFGGKRELFDAALARYRQQQVEPVLADLERHGAGLPELRRYLATLAASFRADPALGARGCLVVNTMTELGARDEAARATAIAYQRRVTAALSNGLRGLSASDARRSDADARARVLFAAVVGALVTAHLDPEGAAELCDQLSRELVPDA